MCTKHKSYNYKEAYDSQIVCRLAIIYNNCYCNSVIIIIFSQYFLFVPNYKCIMSVDLIVLIALTLITLLKMLYGSVLHSFMSLCPTSRSDCGVNFRLILALGGHIQVSIDQSILRKRRKGINVTSQSYNLMSQSQNVSI